MLITLKLVINLTPLIMQLGFGLSRSKMGKLIDAGDITVDWRIVTNAATSLRVVILRYLLNSYIFSIEFDLQL